MIYKIYTLSDPRTNEIRYIGRTIDDLNNRLSKHIYERKKAKNHRCHWINKLYKLGLKPIIEILDETNDIALYFSLESYWIYQFKYWGFNLVNETYGGEGSLGYKHSEETKLKLKSLPRKPKKIVYRMSKQEQAAHISKCLSNPLLEYDTNGNFIREWKNSKEAADFHNVWNTAIISAVNKPFTSCKKHFWRRKTKDYPLKIDVCILTGNKNPLYIYDTLKEILIEYKSNQAAFDVIGRPRDIKMYFNKNKLFKNRYKFYTDKKYIT